MEGNPNKAAGNSLPYFFNLIKDGSKMIYYIVFSYPVISGVLWEVARKPNWADALIWILSPLFLPIYVGMFLSKIFNK